MSESKYADAIAVPFHTPVVIVPIDTKELQVVILPCVACVVAVLGARPAIVATVSAWPVKAPTKEVEVIEVAYLQYQQQ